MAELTTLGGACERVDYGLTTAAVDSKSGPRLLRITDIDGSHIAWDSVPRCAADPSQTAKYQLVDGDIVVARTGASTGRSQWVQTVEPSVFASYLVRFRTNKEFDSRFVAYVLQTEPWFEHVKSVAHGKSAQPNISARDMGAFEFSAPGLVEQRAIAEVLGALDDKIAANTRVVSAAETLAVARVSALHRWTTLGSLVTHHRTMVSPDSLADPVVEHFSLPSFDSGKHPELAAPSSIKSGKFAIEQPSVLLSKLNPRIPRIWLTPASTGIPQLASTEFLVLAPRALEPAVLWALAMQPSFSAALEGKVAGTSGSHQRVKPSDMLDTPIGDPAGLAERDRFEIVALCGSAQSSRTENIILAATRDALLPALMSGKLRIKDAERVVSDAV